LLDELMSVKERKKDSIVISLICNILLMIGKGVTGLLANSNALIADAVHSLIDISVFFMNYRACRDCKIYRRIDRKRTSEKISQRLVDTRVYATYYAGILFFTIGMAICFHNFMILVLDKAKRPDFITFIVAFISLVVYVGLYKYLEDTHSHKIEDCVFMSRNTYWQNKMNLFIAIVVAIGLTGAMLGFVFMDELAALVVGSMVVGMGLRLIMEAREDFNEATKRYFKFMIIGSILMAVVLITISLSIQLQNEIFY